MCHMQNFLLTTFKELRLNKINKINMKKGEMNTTPLFSNIWWNSARSWVWGVSWWYMHSRKIRRNENVINALKQKVLDMYTHWHVNSLLHSDAIWQLRSGSTLAQLMVCCLTAPSHYLNQCWLINWLRGMQLRAISQEVKRIQSVTWMRNLHFWNTLNISQGLVC